MKRIVLMICACFSFLFSSESASYGWNVPHTPFYIGGYVDGIYDETQEESFLFDDLGVLISADGEHFDFLSEIEISHLSLDGKSNGSSDIRVNVERFQLSYGLSNDAELRIGRFNSDIGYWNQAAVNILQDTTTHPHIIKHIFPKATTGFMYKQHTQDHGAFSLMIQHNKDIGQKDDSIVADRHMALGYEKEYDAFSWRAGGGFYREIKGVEARYAGVGMAYEFNDFGIQGEFFTQKNKEGVSKPYSAYVQPIWYYNDKQNFVLRVERYKDEVLEVSEGIMLLGHTYRPRSNMALKAEYVYHTKEPLDRFVYSFSVMF